MRQRIFVALSILPLIVSSIQTDGLAFPPDNTFRGAAN